MTSTAAAYGSFQHFTNLFVKNLPDSWDTDALLQNFEQFGEVVSHKVITDEATGQSKCHGFISFKEHDQAEAAVEMMHEKEIEGKVIISSFCAFF
jgi:polyadenylate-binding protein